MTTFFDDLVGSSAVSFGLTASAKATALLLIAAFGDVALRRHSAAARHLLWTAALIGAWRCRSCRGASLRGQS